MSDLDEILAQRQWLRALAKRLISDEHLQEDLIQETNLVAMNGAGASRAGLRPWLAGVVRKLAARMHRTREQRHKSERQRSRSEGGSSTAEVVAQVELHSKVVEAVLALREPYRSTILLRYWESLPPREIAKRLDIPVATVRTRLRRGHELLRERLDRQHGGRAAWMSALAPLGGLSAPTMSALKSALLTLPGVFLMSLKTKSTFAAAAVLLVAFLAWQLVPELGGSGYEADEARPARLPALEGAGQGEEPVTDVRRDLRDAAAPVRALPTETTPSGVTLTGRVVDDASGLPVPGAEVRLVDSFPRSPYAELEREGPRVRANKRGEFRIEGERELLGSFDDVRIKSELHAPLVVSLPVLRIRKESTAAHDLGEYRLVRGAEVRGRVLAADGRTAVPDALLLLDTDQTSFNRFPPAHCLDLGRSVRDGSFALSERVAPSLRRGHVLYAVSAGGIGWRRLHVVKKRSAIEGCDIVLEPRGRLEVSVEDPQGKPIAGAHLSAEPLFPPLGYQGITSHELWFGRRPEVLALFTARTDERGRAVFSGLPLPGTSSSYDIVARAEGFRKAWRTVSLDRDRVIEIELNRRSAATCTISGVVRSTRGFPVHGARVRAGKERETTTDASGRFRLEGLRPRGDRQWLTVTARGFGPRSRSIKLAPGTSRDDVVITVEAVVPVVGRILDQHGAPVERALVILQRAGSSIRGLRTNSDGRFAFPNAVDAELQLLVRPPEPRHDWERAFVVPVRGGDRSLEVLMRRLPQAHVRLVAEVRDLETDAPLDPAEAELRVLDTRAPLDPSDAALRAEGASDAARLASPPKVERSAGKVIVEKLQQGSWALRVRTANGLWAEKRFRIARGDRLVRIQVRAAKPGVAIGSLNWAEVPQELRSGEMYVTTDPPRSGISIWSNGARAPAAKIDASGGFRFDALTPGVDIELTLVHRWLVGRTRINLRPGEERRIELMAVHAGRLKLEGTQSLPIRSYQTSISRDGKRWEIVRSVPGLRQRLSVAIRAAPGHLRWRVRALPRSPQARELNAEGKATIVAGTTVETEVSFH